MARQVPKLESKLKALPAKPGVYLFRDAGGEVLYIGKAKSLRPRVRSYFQAGTNLMYAVGAIVGLIGAVKVYNKWQSGDHDTGKTAAAWFGSCVFLVVVTTVIRSFFGI